LSGENCQDDRAGIWVKRAFRLSQTSDFQRVRRMGKSYAHPLVVLIKARNNQVQTRIGFTAGSAVGNAVHRNRAKRRLRAAVQPYLSELAPGWDLVLIARKPITAARFDQIETCLQALFFKAELIINSHEMENSGFRELSGGAAPAGSAV